jgi:SAM-dependent methyltransferase
MTQPNSDYYGLVASTWDLWRDDTANWSDRAFFLDMVRRYGEPALDVGCATGRLVLDYAAQGIDIDGVDNAPEMLAICRRKAERMGISPGLYAQNLEALELPRRYRTILIPSSTLQLLIDPADAALAARRCYEHLLPGGALIASFSFGWREGDALDTGWESLFEKVRPEDGATVRSWTHEWHEPEAQVWHAEQRFEVVRDGRVIESAEYRRSPEGRWYTQAQAVKLFRGAGLDDIAVFGGFEHRPATDDDRLFCVLGVRR